jgi:DnaJ homolog subfamily B member 6
MFKKIAEAYDTLIDSAKRREYDNIRNTPDLSSFGRNSYGRSSSSYRPSNSHRGFSRDMAFDIFNHFFADMEDFHNGFMDDHFASSRQRSNKSSHRDPFDDHFGRASSLFGRDPFVDDDFGSFGSFSAMRSFGRMQSMFDDLDNMHNQGFSSSSSSFSSISYGSGMTGKSTSTSTYISADGTRRTRTETTIIHPDGRRETKVDEKVHEPENRRLAYSNDADSSALRINRVDTSKAKVRSSRSQW